LWPTFSRRFEPIDASKFLRFISTRFKVKIPRSAVVISLLLIAQASVFGQESPSNATLTTNPVFEKNCAKCHGKTAEGRHFGGPALVSEKVHAVSADDLRSIIMNGKGRMPKFAGKLTSEEIDTLVQQIKALSPK
jgi:mono/diheme cytochrome c family protein